MIDIKYKKMYDLFINHYKEKHVAPWHEISEKELNQLYEKMINMNDINDDYSFNYMMNYIIKKLNGASDAHTKYDDVEPLPINFRIFDNEILVNYPNELKGFKLVAINNINVNLILKEIENIISYGTIGKRIYQIERTLFNKKTLLGLPSLRGSEKISYEIVDNDNKKFIKEFNINETYENKMFGVSKYLYGNPGTYEIKENNLIITHSSIQNKFKTKIDNMVKELEMIDLSNIETIIVDIRGNTGGNSANNASLIEFLRKSNKKIICLTDYRVFSGGRYALLDLIRLGAITIGTGISTPLNCFGNSDYIEYDNHYFSTSSCYLAPNIGWSALSHEEYSNEANDIILEPKFYCPDIYVEQTKEDYINGIDTILEYAINISKANKL